jgi:excisionase family DNA binding protein
MNADDLFTAPQVAKICSTDLKTIHNWVNRGEIKSFRTPGRHLRFRRDDVLDFLGRFGYPIPEGFAPTKQRIVIIENEEDSLRTLQRTLSKEFEVDGFSDNVDALLSIGQRSPNLVLVRDDSGNTEEIIHLVQRLSSQKNSCPIAVYGESDNHEVAAKEAGAADYVHSIDGREIRRRLDAILTK